MSDKYISLLINLAAIFGAIVIASTCKSCLLQDRYLNECNGQPKCLKEYRKVYR